MRSKEGKRLEAFVRQHWAGDGGMRGLCAASGIAPETLYRWFRGETEPDLGSVRQLAAALNVTRAQVVAATDGQLAPPDWRAELRAALREVRGGVSLEEAAQAGAVIALRDAGIAESPQRQAGAASRTPARRRQPKSATG